MNKEELSSKLLLALSKANMTQTELANKAKVSQSSVNYYCQGKYVPSVDIWSRICEVLDLKDSWDRIFKETKHLKTKEELERYLKDFYLSPDKK